MLVDTGFRKSYIVAIGCYSMDKTTIQVSVGTLERLKGLRRFARESYDDVINFVVDDYEDEELSAEEIEEIQAALEEVKRGKVVSFDDVLKEASISLD